MIDYKKYFLRLMVIALVLSALIAIAVFLTGEFGETEIRLIKTTLAIGAYSLTALCCASTLYREKLRIFSVSGLLVSLLAFTSTLLIIWGIVSFEDTWKAMLVLVIMAVGMGQISLLLLVKPKSEKIKYSMMVTILLIIVVSLMIIKSTFTEFQESGYYYRLLGIFSVLVVLGTVTIPILNKISGRKV